MTDPVDLDDARENHAVEREEDYLSPGELAFLAEEEGACPTCGGTGRKP